MSVLDEGCTTFCMVHGGQCTYARETPCQQFQWEGIPWCEKHKRSGPTCYYCESSLRIEGVCVAEPEPKNIFLDEGCTTFCMVHGRQCTYARETPCQQFQWEGIPWCEKHKRSGPTCYYCDFEQD